MTELGPMGQLHALVHALRYRPLDGLIGRRVMDDGYRSLERLGRELTGFPEASVWEPRRRRTFRRCLWRRYAIDLYLEVPVARLPAPDPRANLRHLLELGLLGETVEERARLREGFGVDLLLEGRRERCGFVRILMQPPETPMLAPKRPRWLRHGHMLLPGYFPREVEVVDACVTNELLIWGWKYPLLQWDQLAPYMRW